MYQFGAVTNRGTALCPWLRNLLRYSKRWYKGSMTKQHTDSNTITRRQYIKSTVAIGGSVVGLGWLLQGCGSKDAAKEEGKLSCTSTEGLSQAEVTMRTTLKYVDHSPDPNKTCSKCNLYVNAAKPNTCGGCQVVKGPIHPDGYCTSWVAKQG